MYQAIRATSKTLQRYLNAELANDTSVVGIDASNQPITLSNFRVWLWTPKEMAEKEGISLWLYRVVRDEHRLNDQQVRIDSRHLKEPPLPLRLHYLLTPVTTFDKDKEDGSREIEHYLLGKVLQLFHGRPRLSGADLKEELAGTGAELSVRLESMALEEITRVWDALEGSYKLSVSYEVSLVNIDAATEPVNVSPVLTVKPRYGVIVEGGAP